MEGDTPVHTSTASTVRVYESACLGMQAKVGGRVLPRLNTGRRPIANKYCEGKVKRTLERE